MFNRSRRPVPHRDRHLDPLRGLAFVGLMGLPAFALAREYRIDHETGTRYGAPVAVASGTARAYLNVRDGAPTELGVAVSESALVGAWDGHDPESRDPAGVASHEYSLPLPKRNPTPFSSVSLRWDPPDGLESVGLAGRAHLHLRFYTVHAGERPIERRDARRDSRRAPYRSPELVSRERAATQALTAVDVHCEGPAESDADRERPAGTLVSRSLDGDVIVLDCRATAPFLPSRASVSAEIPRAARPTPPGYHGGRQRLIHDAARREYHIVLDDFAVDD